MLCGATPCIVAAKNSYPRRRVVGCAQFQSPVLGLCGGGIVVFNTFTSNLMCRFLIVVWARDTCEKVVAGKLSDCIFVHFCMFFLIGRRNGCMAGSTEFYARGVAVEKNEPVKAYSSVLVSPEKYSNDFVTRSLSSRGLRYQTTI